MSKPFQLLQTFTEKEFINFQQLLDSGYLSTNPRLSKLLKILTKKVNVFKSFTPALQHTLFESIYGKDKKFDCKKLNELMNHLLKAAEKFLMFEKIKDTDEHNATLLFPELIKRKQFNLNKSKVKAQEKKLSLIKKRDAKYYNKSYHIQAEKARLQYINNTFGKEDNLNELQYHLDVNYILEKLSYHLLKVTLNNVYRDKDFDLRPFKALNNLLDLPQYSTNPLIQISLLNIDLVKNEDNQTFNALSQAITAKIDIVPAHFLKRFYTNLSNYCVKQITKGNLSYYKNLLEIFKEMDKVNLLTINGTIDIGLLKNIITNACMIEEFDWAKKILEKYKDNINEEDRESVVYYNLGIICFNQKNYNGSLTQFNKVKKIDEIHEIGIKVTTLKCFYETDLVYDISTHQAINSRKVFFRTNKTLSLEARKAYLNFITIFNMLYKLKDAPTQRDRILRIKKDIDKIEKKFNEKELMKEKKWLHTKIDILKIECK